MMKHKALPKGRSNCYPYTARPLLLDNGILGRRPVPTVKATCPKVGWLPRHLLYPRIVQHAYIPWYNPGLEPLTPALLLLLQIRELVPESQAYMDLLAFERKLDQTIMRKRVDIQEALKRPMKVP